MWFYLRRQINTVTTLGDCPFEQALHRIARQVNRARVTSLLQQHPCILKARVGGLSEYSPSRAAGLNRASARHLVGTSKTGFLRQKSKNSRPGRAARTRLFTH